jgi:excisionase family DNA binding protein
LAITQLESKEADRVTSAALDYGPQPSEAMEPMDALMTIEEVASYFRLSTDTVCRMAQAGKIPASKVATQWRFRKEDVDARLEKNKNVPEADRPPTRPKR